MLFGFGAQFHQSSVGKRRMLCCDVVSDRHMARGTELTSRLLSAYQRRTQAQNRAAQMASPKNDDEGHDLAGHGVPRYTPRESAIDLHDKLQPEIWQIVP
jgi:hypothetical protein